MDFLTSEINKLKRKATTAPDQKFIKRSEIEAQRQREYDEDQARLRKLAEQRESQKLQQLAEYEASKRRKTSDRAAKAEAGEHDIAEVRAKLTELREPVLLFGEDHKEVRARLRRLIAKRERLAASGDEILKIVYTDEPLPDAQDLEIRSEWTKSEEDRVKLQQNMFLLFRGYIKSWDAWIASHAQDRDAAAAATIHRQAKEQLARLLLRLKTSNLPPDILTNLSHVAIGLKKRDYMAANHAYLQMSIGKAAWPVGVTSVGIHERAQRQRINKEIDAAHILADETTRQWLQSLKRLITQLEKTDGH